MLQQDCSERISYENIPKTFGHYTFSKIIDYGGYSVVVKAVDNHTNISYACKIISREAITKSGLIQRTEQELRILERIRHPNIASIREIVYTEKYIIVVMEYCNQGTLHDYIFQTTFTYSQILNTSKCLLSAIDYLHRMGVCHRDIKLENIVLDKDFNPKIIDFGLSYLEFDSNDNLRKTYCGTLEFMPPEILCGLQYDGKKADIWSLGVCLYIISTGICPFKGSDREIASQIIKGETHLEALHNTQMASIIGRMLQIDPMKREDASSLIKLFNKTQVKFIQQQNTTTSSAPLKRQQKLIVKPFTRQASSMKDVTLGRRIFSFNQ